MGLLEKGGVIKTRKDERGLNFRIDLPKFPQKIVMKLRQVCPTILRENLAGLLNNFGATPAGFSKNYFNACKISFKISSLFSKPTEIRINPGVIPTANLSSSDNLQCVEEEG